MSQPKAEKGNRQGFDPRIEQRIQDLRAEAKKHLAASEYHEALSCLDLAVDLHSSSYKVAKGRSPVQWAAPGAAPESTNQ